VGGKEGWDLGFHKIITRAGGDKDRRVWSGEGPVASRTSVTLLFLFLSRALFILWGFFFLSN
jgi:hypothetical protein